LVTLDEEWILYGETPSCWTSELILVESFR
jgi:hypothetical protein